MKKIETPRVPVSWGELLDKITILEIKSVRLTSEQALRNVRNELAALAKIVGDAGANSRVAELKEKLKKVNEALWDIEDRIREHESRQAFNSEFIELARSVYKNNDERGRLKREINRLLNSEIIEEKQYKPY